MSGVKEAIELARDMGIIAGQRDEARGQLAEREKVDALILDELRTIVRLLKEIEYSTRRLGQR